MRPVPCGDQGILRVLEGNMVRLTHGVPTIQIERIPVVMQEFVVGILPTWIDLLRRVVRAVLFYMEDKEASAADDVED